MVFILWLLFLSFLFANVEIQIEGKDGWASSLPTWRIEKSPVIDLFWGGRPITGYHVWILSFMFVVFHFPFFIFGTWSLKFELRILGSLMIFWIAEDFFWFIFNPYYGLSKFKGEFISWHKEWLFGVPKDYVIFTIIGISLLLFSYWNNNEYFQIRKKNIT